MMISTLEKFRDVVSSEILVGLEKEMQTDSATEEVGNHGVCCNLDEQQDLDQILEWGKRVLNDARGVLFQDGNSSVMECGKTESDFKNSEIKVEKDRAGQGVMTIMSHENLGGVMEEGLSEEQVVKLLSEMEMLDEKGEAIWEEVDTGMDWTEAMVNTPDK
jgi:hypothetical protein